MSYLFIFMTSAVVLTLALHVRQQFRQTNGVRQDLANARATNTLTGMHNLRVKK